MFLFFQGLLAGNLPGISLGLKEDPVGINFSLELIILLFNYDLFKSNYRSSYKLLKCHYKNIKIRIYLRLTLFFF